MRCVCGIWEIRLARKPPSHRMFTPTYRYCIVRLIDWLDWLGWLDVSIDWYIDWLIGTVICILSVFTGLPVGGPAIGTALLQRLLPRHSHLRHLLPTASVPSNLQDLPWLDHLNDHYEAFQRAWFVIPLLRYANFAARLDAFSRYFRRCRGGIDRRRSDESLDHSAGL